MTSPQLHNLLTSAALSLAAGVMFFTNIAQASEMKPEVRLEYVALHLPDGSTDFVPKSKFSADTLRGIQLVASQKFSEGKKLLLRQVENGDEAARCVLGIMQIRGVGFRRNVQAGLEQIEQSAQNGFTRGYYYLSYISAFTQFSVEQSLQWAIKGAERGDFTALTEMATNFFTSHKAQIPHFVSAKSKLFDMV